MPEYQLGEASKNRLIKEYQRKAAARGLTFRLTRQEFYDLTRSNCYYCGSEPSNVFKNNRDRDGFYIYNGIDRLKNNVGYTSLNSVACCKRCNFAKAQMTEQEFMQMVDEIFKYQNK